MRARAWTGILIALALAGLLAACSPSVSPSATSAPETTPTSLPTATADATPTPSPVVTPPSTPVATAATDCPSDPRPSTLAALDIATRLACYGSTPLTFGAVVVPGTDLPVPDGAPLPVPERFRQVSLPEYGPLFLVDPGTVFVMETRLPLYVAGPAGWPTNYAVNFRGCCTEGAGSTPPAILTGGAMITGHFDDPASADCRGRPVDDAGNGPFTDEQVIQWCRGTFIVTSIETGG